jgi:hypothetical protein
VGQIAGTGAVGHELGFSGRGETLLSGLLAVFPVGPTGPAESGQEEKNDEKDDSIPLHGDVTSWLLLYEFQTVNSGQWTANRGSPAANEKPWSLAWFTIRNRCLPREKKRIA